MCPQEIFVILGEGGGCAVTGNLLAGLSGRREPAKSADAAVEAAGRRVDDTYVGVGKQRRAYRDVDQAAAGSPGPVLARCLRLFRATQ
jgi:hypothetical protein